MLLHNNTSHQQAEEHHHVYPTNDSDDLALSPPRQTNILHLGKSLADGISIGNTTLPPTLEFSLQSCVLLQCLYGSKPLIMESIGEPESISQCIGSTSRYSPANPLVKAVLAENI